MKTLAASVLAASLALTPAAFAGGPVVVEEDPTVEAATPQSGWIVPVVIGAIILCAIACGDEEEVPVDG